MVSKTIAFCLLAILVCPTNARGQTIDVVAGDSLMLEIGEITKAVRLRSDMTAIDTIDYSVDRYEVFVRSDGAADSLLIAVLVDTVATITLPETIENGLYAAGYRGLTTGARPSKIFWSDQMMPPQLIRYFRGETIIIVVHPGDRIIISVKDR